MRAVRYLLVLVLFANVSCGNPSAGAGAEDSVMVDDIVRIEREEPEEYEGWERLTDEPTLRGVEAIRLPTPGPAPEAGAASQAEWSRYLAEGGRVGGGEGWDWQVSLYVAEFVREEPAESKLREQIAEALRSVDGVLEVVETDREVWEVRGDPSGRALVSAAATVVDRLAEEIRGQYPEMRWGEG